MTAVEIATIVYRREMAGAATDSGSIARWLGESEWTVRSALVIARKCGLIVHRYRADAPFGDRDTYITTHKGRQAAKEMATP